MKHRNIVIALAIAAVSPLTLVSGAGNADDGSQSDLAHAPYTYGDSDSVRGIFTRIEHEYRDTQASEQLQASLDIDSRRQEQMRQIMHGLRSGSLSRREAEKLMREQDEINQLQRQYLADRRLSHSELMMLDRRLDRASRNIRAEKRDRNRH